MAFFPGGPASHPGPGPGIHGFGPGGPVTYGGASHPLPTPVRSSAGLADFLKAAAGVHPRAGASAITEAQNPAFGRAPGSMADLYPQLALAAGGHPGPGGGISEAQVPQQIDSGYNPAVYQRAIGNTAQAAADWEAHHPYAMNHGHIPGWLQKYMAAQMPRPQLNIAAAAGAPAAPPVQPQSY